MLLPDLSQVSSRISLLSLRTAKRASYGLLLAVLALAGAQAYSLKKLDTHYSMRQFLPLNHPLFLSDDEIKHEFSLGQEEPVLVTLQLAQTANGSWLSPERVKLLERATSLVASVKSVQSAASLATIETATDSAGGIEVGNLLKLIPPPLWKERVARDALLEPGFISSDQRTVMIVGEIGILSSEDVAKMVSSLREKMAAIFPNGGEVKAMVGGVIPLQSDMTILIGKELQRFLVLGLLACIITLVAYFRGFSAVIACLFLAVISNLGALSWMAMTGLSFSVLSTSVPVLASITALAIGSHTLLNFGNRWETEKSRNPTPDRIRIIQEIYGGLFLPNLLTALTTTIGFATLATSDVPLIKQFALSVSGGIMCGWLSISLALPPLMYLLPPPQPRKWTSSSAKWAIGVIRFRQIFFGLVIAGIVAVAFHGIHLNWSVQLFDDLPNIGSAKSVTTVVDRDLGGMIPLDIMIRDRSGSATGQSPWNDPVHIRKMQEILARWRTDPVVGSGIGLSDFTSITQKASRQSLAENFFLLSLSESNPLLHFLSADGASTRLSFRLRDVPADEMAKTVHAIEADVRHSFPGAEVLAGGLANTIHTLNAELSKQLMTGLWQSLICISLLLIIVLRSVRLALIAAIPNLLAPFALITTMAILRTPIKPTVAVIFSIALGVAYNNTVYLMSRLKTLSDKFSSPHIDPMRFVRKAWYQEGNPCLFSSLAIFGGFAVFLSSYFALNRTFGAYMLWSIGVGLFGDLIFLPVLLGIFPSLLSGKKIIKIPIHLPMQHKEPFLYKTLIVIFSLATLVLATPGLAAPTAEQILKDVAQNLHSSDEQARVKMSIIEANGSEKVRGLEISRLETTDGQSVLVRLLNPADLRGMGFLSVNQGSQVDQWLYLPSSKQTRRIVGGKKGANFLDSELSYEDMGSSSAKNFTASILKTEADKTVIESKTTQPDSAYSRILTWIDLKSKLVSRIEYYDQANALLKTTTMSNYKKFANGVWRAQEVVVQNVQNHRGTKLELTDLKFNRGLSSKNFSPSALANP